MVFSMDFGCIQRNSIISSIISKPHYCWCAYIIEKCGGVGGDSTVALTLTANPKEWLKFTWKRTTEALCLFKVFKN